MDYIGSVHELKAAMKEHTQAKGCGRWRVKSKAALPTMWFKAAPSMTDETLKKIAHELTENLRQNLSADWSERESVRAKLRLMVKRILRKYKYPPDLQEAAVELVLQQAQVLGDSWA